MVNLDNISNNLYPIRIIPEKLTKEKIKLKKIRWVLDEVYGPEEWYTYPNENIENFGNKKRSLYDYEPPPKKKCIKIKDKCSYSRMIVYDINGNILECTDKESDLVTLSERWVYNDNGQLVTVHSNNKWDRNTCTKHIEYDNKGNKICIRNHIVGRLNRNDINIIMYVYDDSNNMIRELFYNYNKELVKVFLRGYYNNNLLKSELHKEYKTDIGKVFNYDINNNLIQIIERDRIKGSTNIVYFSYDDKFNLIEKRFTDEKGNEINKFSYEYNSDSKIIKKIEKYIDIFKYNLEGRLINISQLNLNGELLSETSFTYEDGNLVFEKGIEIISYKYDSKNNIIEKVKYGEFDEPIEIIKYEYGFYQ